ncbi:XdhC family protein [Actinomadura rudentiformis]|uniref:XdhC family protein n=1 Tax=Actinomadura rudentiformis TaxID=359158 RepID=A0A6H9YP51_9ACTN|nr:XdhC family protein [Actinomadura rudentiformis]KAB2343261.1 XdhC family protein [Actinomadura rudentiformis]
MREIADRLRDWHSAGTAYAVATVISVGGSAPRQPGAAMAVFAGGEAVGSVSGGCVEGAVYELCQEALRTGTAIRESFGYSDDDAFAVGLTCGGTIEVFVQPGPVPESALTAISRDEQVAVAHLMNESGTTDGTTRGAIYTVWPDRHAGSSGLADVDQVVVGEARAMLDGGTTGIRSVRCREGLDVFVQSYAPAPRLLVFGAIDYATAVARMGAFLGYRVTVCDARPVFATPARFPDADEVIVDWPHRYLNDQAQRGLVDGRTVVCVLTHDAKFDVPLLDVALRLQVAYVGAMGSRRTHDDRMRRLRDAGMTDAELARLHSPIGLDLGARTPEETALSIAAEFVALRRGGSGVSLGRTRGPIHHDAATVPGVA